MNLFEREARDIKAFLERHGYTCRQDSDHIVVDDPVWGYEGGAPYRRLTDNKVKVRDWPAALRFVSERS